MRRRGCGEESKIKSWSHEHFFNIVLSLLLCVTMNSIYTVEGFTNFTSKTDMMANVSALAFACVSDFFAQIPGNVDYGNNLAMFGYNSRIYCLLKMILDKETQERIKSNFCLPWTEEEAEARIFAIKVLVDVCDELHIPVLHLNFGGSNGTNAAVRELKKIKSKLFFRVDITSHLATFTKYYSAFRNGVKQKVSLTTKAESMDAPIDQFLEVVLARMHQLDSSCTLEMPELSFSDTLKNNEHITYVCRWDDEMTSTRADMERVKEKKQEQKRIMKLAASIVFKQCKVDWTQKNPNVTSKDTSTPRYAHDVIQPRSLWTTAFSLHEKHLSKVNNGKLNTNKDIVNLLMQHADLDELRSCNSAYSLRNFIMNKDETLKNIAWSDKRWEDQDKTEGIKSLLSKALNEMGVKKKVSKKEEKKVVQINRDLINPDPKAKSCIEKPGPNDVMTGRGGGTNSHPGNIKFRRIVEDKKSTYQASSTKEKTDLTKEVVADWRALDPPGRFLERNSETGLWDDIGDSLARVKCSQLFRGKKSEKRKATEVEAISVQDGFGEKDTVRESMKRKATEVEPITLQDEIIDPPHHTVPHNQTILLEGFKWDDDSKQIGRGIVDESSVIYTSSGRVNVSQCIYSDGMVGSLDGTKKRLKWSV